MHYRSHILTFTCRTLLFTCVYLTLMLKRNKISDLTLQFFFWVPPSVHAKHGFGCWKTDNLLLSMIKRFNWPSTNTTACSLTLLVAARCSYSTQLWGRSPKLKSIHLSATLSFFTVGRLYSDLNKALQPGIKCFSCHIATLFQLVAVTYLWTVWSTGPWGVAGVLKLLWDL